MSTLIEYVRRIALGSSLEGETDAELLSRFAQSRDEAAFAQLVHRHGGMVLAVCRRMLGNTADAEDSFQATFLVLARRAGSIRKRELLGNWLCGVARRVAAKARATGQKRRLREQPMIDSDQFADRLLNHGSELQAVLDEEVARLPARYRKPLVLCYLDGVSNETAARLLNCPKGTVQSRLAWARERLRSRLSRRGFALSALVAGLEGTKADAAAPISPALVDATVHSAVLYVSGNSLAAGGVSASVAALTQGVLHTMFMIKVKTIAAAVLVVLLAGATAGVMARANLAAVGRHETGDGSKATDVDLRASNFDLRTNQVDRRSKIEDRRSENDARRSKIEEVVANHDDERIHAKEVVAKNFKTGKSPKVVLETFNGGIEVEIGNDEGVRVEVTKKSEGSTEESAKEGLKYIVVTMGQTSDGIHVRARREQESWPHEQLGASAKLRVPRSAALELHSSNGGVRLNGGDGTVNVNTSNGEIVARDHGGPLHLNTSNGNIDLDGVKGVADVHTSNGPIRIHSAGAKVDAATSNGTIRFQGRLANGKHTFETSNGSVVLAIPPDMQFAIDASTSQGRISTGFKLESSSDRSKTHLHGQVGTAPAISLEVHTSNGSIAIEPLEAGKSVLKTDEEDKED
jgi:RNA polymerase sigma factor (sigma-70 family)